MARTILGSLLDREFRNELNRMLLELYDGMNTATGTKNKIDAFLDGTGVVTRKMIANNSVDTTKIADSSVNNSKIADGSVSADKLGNSSVTTNKIENGAVTHFKLGTNSVRNEKIADGAVDELKIADGAVNNSKIADSSVTNSKLGTRSITWDKLDEGSVTGSRIADGAVSSSKIQDGSVDSTKLGARAVDTSHIKDDAVTSSRIAENAVGKRALLNGSVDNAKIENGAVTNDKIADDSVDELKIADDSVGTSKIQNGAVSGSKIADGAVTNKMLADNSIGNSKIMEGGVHADNIADYQVRANHIINRSLTKEKLDVDEVRINQGENYPMLNVKAGDSWNPYPNEVKNVILSAKVIGAEKDKIYSIRYIANGYNEKWGISLSQHDRNDDKDYPNLVWSSNIEHLTTYDDDRFDHWEPLNDIVHHSIYIASKDVTFEIIYDKTKINGASLNLSNNSAGGIAQGLIIHPMNYIYKQTSVLEDNNKIYMDKQEGRLYVYRRKSNGNYIGVEIRHHQKEIGTDANSNHNLWLVRTIKEYSRSGNTFNPIRSLIHDNNITTMDLMIKESSEMDYMGGINHGDEVSEYISISVNGLPINIVDTGFYEADEIRVTQRNKLYRDTVYTEGVLEHLATVGKEHIFGHGVDYTLKNTVTWHEPVSVVESYLGSMAFYRTDENDNGPVWTNAINDISHTPYDLTTIGGSMIREKNVEEVRVYGNDVSCTVSINRFENKDGNGVHISNFGQSYSKLYASYVPSDYTTTIDEVWKQSTKFNFELGD